MNDFPASDHVLREMEALRPVDYDDLIEHFTVYWEECAQIDKPDEARQQLIAKIVDRVFVYDDRVMWSKGLQKK
jgi:hypothetical protein